MRKPRRFSPLRALVLLAACILGCLGAAVAFLPEVRQAALGTADAFGLPWAERGLEDPEGRARRNAQTRLTRLGGRSILLPRILALLDSDSAAARQAAVRALGNLREAGQARRLASMLGDPSASVRREAAEVLAEMRPPAAVPVVALLLEDPREEVRERALEALGDLVGEDWGDNLGEARGWWARHKADPAYRGGKQP